ncbi:MAG TPA: hypothetical protein VMR21_10140 [Vicinamibacteria bacterium]|nr:hypothetical protein [Vicinamibacteria bacterium]
MKTGRLLKFHRPGGDVQAYLYREGGMFCASVFVLGRQGRRDPPLQTLTADTEAAVERELRAWIEKNFPASAL